LDETMAAKVVESPFHAENLQSVVDEF